MANLFIIHTQYQLILANGIINSTTNGKKNDLVLFLDFNLSNELKVILEKSYDRILYLSGSYPAKNELWRNKIGRYIVIFKEIFKFLKINNKYDNLFLINDSSIPEMLIMKLCNKKCKPVYCYIEDGGDAYFTNTNIIRGGVAKNGITKAIRKFVLKYVLGLGKFYNMSYCFGQHPLIQRGYVLFPDKVRTELRGKHLVEINAEMLSTGIVNIYSNYSNLNILGNSIIFFLDKPTTYISADRISKIVDSIIQISEGKRCNVYFKYHPREEIEYCKVLGQKGIKIEQSIPAEVIIKSVIDKGCVVVGTKSTSLYTAAKLGIRTISIINILDNSEYPIAKVFNRLGVEIPNEVCDVL